MEEKEKNHMWTLKHSPKNLKDIQGQNKAIAAILRFVEDYPKNKAALLHGPPGTGKTSAITALAKEKNYEILEFNASDFRTEAEINLKLKNAVSQQSLFGKNKIMLIDEIDGISGTYDKGGVQAISKIISGTNYPLFITANNPWDRKLSEIRKKSVMIEFPKLRYDSIASLLKKIALSEKIKYDDSALTEIGLRSSGDARSAIIDLQSLGKEKVTKKDVNELYDRDREEKIINSLIRVFKTTSEETALKAFDYLQEDIDEILMWIDENLPYEYKKPYDLYRAYERIIKSDQLRGRIRSRQHWRFMAYIFYYLTVGIATAKDEKYEGFSRIRPTQRILKIWMANNKRAAMKSIAEKMAKENHYGTKELMKENIYYIKSIAKHDKNFFEHLKKKYSLEQKETEWLKK